MRRSPWYIDACSRGEAAWLIEAKIENRKLHRELVWGFWVGGFFLAFTIIGYLFGAALLLWSLLQ